MCARTHNSAMVEQNYLTVSYVYQSRGIPLKTFIDKKETIEASLNIIALDIRQGADRSQIIIKAVSGQHQLPDRIDWNDRYLSDKPSEILLGVSEADVMRIDLDALPHVQCGGITGSGKSVLLRCVLHQLYLNGFQIYLCDFKNLIDFSSKERQVYDCLTSKEELLDVLQRLVGIMNTRKELFASEYCTNITEYNAKHPETPCKRIILASDEIAYTVSFLRIIVRYLDYQQYIKLVGCHRLYRLYPGKLGSLCDVNPKLLCGKQLLIQIWSFRV